jgi:hypothetical protein
VPLDSSPKDTVAIYHHEIDVNADIFSERNFYLLKHRMVKVCREAASMEIIQMLFQFSRNQHLGNLFQQHMSVCACSVRACE